MAQFARYSGKAIILGACAATGLIAETVRAYHSPYATHEMYPASSNFPDLSANHSYMAKVLTPEVCVFYVYF